MELLSSTLLRTTVSLALLLLKPLRPWLAALPALVAALSVAEALMTASLSWLPVVLRLACARPDAWLEMPPRAEEAWPLPGTPSLRRRTVGVPRSSARKCTTFQWGDTQRVYYLGLTHCDSCSCLLYIAMMKKTENESRIMNRPAEYSPLRNLQV